MLKFIILLIWSFALQAGVGGIDGGSVHFQKDSTWVNMVYSKSLCYKNEKYFSKSRKCTKWEHDSDDRKCVSYVPTIIEQPRESTRLRCKKRDDDNCLLWERIPYVQKRTRLVKFLDEDRRVLEVKKLRVKSCK